MTRHERRKRALVRLERELKKWESAISHTEVPEIRSRLTIKIQRKQETIANTKKKLGYE
jgi:hypothetical protein